MNGPDDLVFEMADPRRAGQTLAAILESPSRLGAALLERAGENANRRLPELFVVDGRVAQGRNFGVEAQSLGASPWRGDRAARAGGAMILASKRCPSGRFYHGEGARAQSGGGRA